MGGAESATKGQEQKLANGRIRFPVTIPLGEPEGEAPGADGELVREEEG